MFRGKKGWSREERGRIAKFWKSSLSPTAATPPNKGVGLDGVRRIAEYIAAEGSGMSDPTKKERKSRQNDFFSRLFLSRLFVVESRIKVAKTVMTGIAEEPEGGGRGAKNLEWPRSEIWSTCNVYVPNSKSNSSSSSNNNNNSCSDRISAGTATAVAGFR